MTCSIALAHRAHPVDLCCPKRYSLVLDNHGQGASEHRGSRLRSEPRRRDGGFQGAVGNFATATAIGTPFANHP